MKKRAIFYEILKFFVAIAHRLFYKEIIVQGRENIPKSGALIFAPNHQNGLMDPLAVLFTNNRLTIFLGRGDIFKNPVLAKLLTILKILPVYRQRDGKDSLEKNEIIFNKAIEILEYKSALCLFPETTHNDKRRLQQLRKGIQRIAFLTEKKNNFSLNIKIVPVGIYYSNYPVSRTILQINYGKPVNVEDYFDLYKENAQKAMLKLRDELTLRIKPMMIDIQNLDFYEMYESLREIYFRNVIKKMKLKNIQKNKFIADKIIIESLDNYAKEHKEELIKLKNKVIVYKEQLSWAKLPDKCISNQKKSKINLLLMTLLLILLSPLSFYVYIVNLIPLFVTKKLVKNVEDIQFHSSFKFGMGIFFFPVYYFIISVLVALISNLTFFNICFFISLWVTLYIYFKFREAFNYVSAEWKYFKLKISNSKEFNEIINFRKEIVKIMDKIVY